MARTSFHGDIETASHETMLGLVRDWLAQPELAMTLRRTGYETTYRDDTIELYCHEAGTPGAGDSFYLLEGIVEAEPARAAERLAVLAAAARAAGLDCSIDYAEADADGAAIGAESTIA
ncbi:hypothetical protein ACFU44_02940 [Nocardia rhizosphaerihabitans]|uniref:hypothetical protein n=1 Tax=Nocardia rhizosphaerihabitans TaxID=1691570 RepID=UPI0036729EA9